MTTDCMTMSNDCKSVLSDCEAVSKLRLSQNIFNDSLSVENLNSMQSNSSDWKFYLKKWKLKPKWS
jgi:hypothetical protein